VSPEPELLSAICGMLSMLSIRSPGAACAIAQQANILPILISLSLTPGAHYQDVDTPEEDTSTTTTFVVDPKRALPTFWLLCTLIRQSRTVAMEARIMESVLSSHHIYSILGMEAQTDEEFEVHRWSLILWRSLLRYV
jgi:hypothetical protein